MATDLPAFDSVWIDALVQMHRLTPFQAQVLESTTPSRLQVGPCVLVERLGGGFHGTTYLARGISHRQLRVLKVVRTDQDRVPEILIRAQALLANSGKVSHPSIVMPRACEQIDATLVFVSRYIPGRTLTEYLIRRGRFPARMVWQIGRQLADGLVKLHAAGLAHGDIRPSQVRLLTEGTAVLVDAGVTAVLEPELSPHSQLTPECYDCVAPELIGTGITPNAGSDLYALGCLLWQLLAGRPPFPGGDPLQKLASHQTRRIRDVRDYAPDTPAPLAEMILRLTSPNPAERPASATAVVKTWGGPRSSGRRQLRRFVESFQHPIEANFRLSSLANSPVAWLLALLFCVSGLTLGMTHEKTRSHLLHIWAKLPGTPQAFVENPEQPLASSVTSSEMIRNEEIPAANPIESLLPLPEPNAQGVIELIHRGPFAARKVAQVGKLVIRARDGVTAEIVVDRSPLLLVAERIVLQGVQIRRLTTSTDPANPALKAIVQVEALQLEVRDAKFLTLPFAGDFSFDPQQLRTNQSGPVALSWKVTEAAAPQSGFATLDNIVFWGNSPALDLQNAARQIVARNVLRLGAGALINVAAPLAGKMDLKLKLEHVTCRQAGSVFRWLVGEDQPGRQNVRIESQDCVFDVLPGQGGLLEFAGGRHVPAWARRVKFVGDASLVSELSEIVVRSDLKTGEITSVDSSELELEGVTQERFTFLGEFGLLPANSAINADYNGIRRNSGLPGVVAKSLPGPQRSKEPIAALPRSSER
ncbi:MAG: serine/threonine protein kinase [Planctomycetaceae bacterium]|nr:serine/threonine protein kinase [Planctomycetaceae bacterium]